MNIFGKCFADLSVLPWKIPSNGFFKRSGGLICFTKFCTSMALLSALFSGVEADQKSQVSTQENGFSTHLPTEKTDGIVKNPGMGWVLYCDAFSQMNNPNFPDYNKGVTYPELFWKTLDECGATAKASIFYLRAPWSFFEPAEGQYAWNDASSKYAILIQGALDRNLKLAFRVYTDSQDSFQQATPQYVRDAGAKGYMNTGYDASGKGVSRWTPYVNDQVFLRLFKKFIAEFGIKYNNPAIVDFLDGMGFGWWGEFHACGFDSAQPANNLAAVLDQVTSAHISAFSNVLLGAVQGGSSIGYSDGLIRKNIYDVLRRDSFGMPQWLSSGDKKYYSDMVVKNSVPVFAENGWNYFAHDFTGYMAKNKKQFSEIRTMLEYCLNDAKLARANTFDLRVPEDAIEWMKNPDLVEDFVLNGGYRLVPTSLTFPKTISSNQFLTIPSLWKNTGLGVVPNNRPQWNGKYKVAYALLDTTTQKTVFTSVTNINPADWLKGTIYNCDVDISFAGIPNGTYHFAYAIVDKSNGNTPALNLAITNQKNASGWYIIGSTRVSGILNEKPSKPIIRPSNFAPTAKIQSSIQNGNSPLENIVNKCTTDAWGSASGVTFPGYITFDFGEKSIAVEKINMITHYGLGQGVTNFDIEIEKDKSWVTSSANVNITWNLNTDEEETKEIQFPPVTTSKIRLKINQGNKQWGAIAINEIEIWGVATALNSEVISK